MTQTHFAAWHRRDRALYIGFVVVAWFVVYMGFGGSIAARFTGKADYPAPLALVIHVFSFFGWLTVLTLQVTLINARRTDLHKLLGLSALVLIPVMTVSALAAEIYSQQHYAALKPENPRFFIVPLVTMAIFAVTSVAALILRKQPSAHKRLILIATSVLMVAAFGRWLAPWIIGMIGDNFWADLVANAAGVDLMIGAAMVHDLITRGRLHRVFVIAMPPIVALQVAAAWIYHTDWWPGIVRAMLGL
ncbi:MAG: hypothetical protein EOP62_05880 [Sphingomonadales bacterium]|nr:MAG: hypothetical protein EOP62_05880 [Sphingomonadales bacterium]